MKYEILLNQLRDPIRLSFCTESDAVLIKEAADAIEELRGVIQRQREMINATAYLPLYQTPKWIPVDERLPEQKGYYLVFSHGVIGTAYYGSKWWTEDPRIYEPQITHWMPMLPEPPKEETDG